MLEGLKCHNRIENACRRGWRYKAVSRYAELETSAGAGHFVLSIKIETSLMTS